MGSREGILGGGRDSPEGFCEVAGVRGLESSPQGGAEGRSGRERQDSYRHTGPVVGTKPPFGGWVCSQLSSDTIRAFHSIAGIRDEGMTGKDLGPMLLGVYSAVRGPSRVGVSDAGGG